MTVLPIVVFPIVVTPPTVVSSLPDSPVVSVCVGLANADSDPCLFVDTVEESVTRTLVFRSICTARKFTRYRWPVAHERGYMKTIQKLLAAVVARRFSGFLIKVVKTATWV